MIEQARKQAQRLRVSGAEIAASVPAREFNRLLQLPRDRELEGDLRNRADGARAWYAQHGDPFVAFNRMDVHHISEDTIQLANNVELHSRVLARRLSEGQAHALIVMAASAGPTASQEVASLWKLERPDEAFFLDRFAVGVTERLIFWTSNTLCREGEAANETMMPHLSPGCGNWDIEDQHKVMSLLSGGDRKLGPLQLMETGALHPQHSVLAAMGLTHLKFAVTPERLCRSCDLSPCAFRRAPYGDDVLRPLEVQ